MTQPTMPRVFLTPSGRPVRPRTMSAALRVIRANPDADYPGWDWFPVPGHMILAQFRRGMHDRINRRQPRGGSALEILRAAVKSAGPVDCGKEVASE